MDNCFIDVSRIVSKVNNLFNKMTQCLHMETIKTISALSAFERVARLQSFTQAAKELGVSKAYISKLIQSLEEELGSVCF